MDLGSRRRGTNGVVAGSVWESRMKLDDFKVFKSEENSEDNNNTSSSVIEETSNNTIDIDTIQNKVVKPKQSPSGKRKTWKSESNGVNPIQIARKISEMGKNLGEKSPIEMKKSRSDDNGVVAKTPVHTTKVRSLSLRLSDEGSNAIEKSPIQLRKVKHSTEANKALTVDDGNEKNSDQRMAKTGPNSSSAVHEDREEFDVCEEKVITSQSAKKSDVIDDRRDCINGDNGDDEESNEVFEELDDEETELEIEKKSLVVKEINAAENKKKKFVIQDKKNLHSNERSIPISPIVKKKLPPVVNNVKIHPSPTKIKAIPVSDELPRRIPRKHRKLQCLVDIVMWRDVSRSALIFGTGTFLILSSSYTQDLNISIISVLSYLGLVYLAAIFLFRSLIFRGTTDIASTSRDHVFGEEEAIWLAKLILPYVNEFFLSLRALFTGDPATTMKMAVLLFVLARCGNSITIWKMAKFGFFGIFIVPKLCSSYSTAITEYGTFWIQRFEDAWGSCSHKKAIAFGAFTLVWNFSSIIARIWAVFMLFVAFKYCQHSVMKSEWREEEQEQEARVEDSWQKQKQGNKIRHSKGIHSIAS